MKTVSSLQQLNDEISTQRSMGKTIGFVPTMGALHNGHLSLINIAKENSDYIVASIFVNPTQFAPHEDFDSYPRTEGRDSNLLEKIGTNLLFLPTQAILYPDGFESDVLPGSEAKGLETDFRPDFFNGVVNVVHRLFNTVKPDVAVFGNKDFQQLQVIKQMVIDTNSTIKIIGAPIVRDAYGLALSSRNANLSDEELKISRSLNVILHDAAKTRDFGAAQKALLASGFDTIDYIDLRWNRLLAAAWLGQTRLIDNVAVD